MSKLVLCEIHTNPYLNAIACAYIYYGSKEKPVDHCQNKIGAFYQEHERINLEAHLNEKVVPLLNKSLIKHGFEAVDVDCVNQVPHPFISICKKDRTPFCGNDILNLEMTIESILTNENRNKLKPSSLTAQSTFASKKERLPDKEYNYHHKNTFHPR